MTDRLARFVEARSHSERVDAFVDLVTWARLGWSGRADDRSYLIALACFLEGDRESADRVRESFAAMTSSLHGSKLFAEAGIPSERGFFAELTERILAKVLPRPREDHDASRIFDRLFGARRHAERFRSMPPELFARLVALLTGREGQATRSTRRTIFTDGFRLLAVRTAAQGLSEKLRAWGHTTHVSGSPFYKLVGASEAVVSEWVKTGDIREALPAWRKVVSACREEMARISGRLETDGVSVDIVYGLEVISICLKRMERMVAIMAPVEKGADIEELHQLLANLVDAAHRDQSVAELFRTNLALLIRKIVDRSGQTGEHYVAESRAVYRHILVAAAGGGLLTAFTAAVKLEVTHLALPLFVVGFLAGLNYAVSFLIMQAFGLILATKQPSMTAAALAKIVREERGDTREQEIVDYAARLCSSQLGAAISNVLVVFAAASAIEVLWRVTFGRSFLNVDHAHYVLETLTPLSGGTLFYAAFTGVILYLGSVAGGWFDNWAVYHRIPQAIRESGFGRIFGAERMDRLSRAARRNFSGIGTNVTLGMMLGLAPSFGAFFGLPLDVRHVTLSTGTLALAVSSVGALAHGWSLLVRAIVGIGVMFVLNLGVSFSLSLWAAARAYRVAPHDMRAIGGALLKRILTHPGEFLRPPRR
jgi:site-specific recombinase